NSCRSCSRSADSSRFYRPFYDREHRMHGGLAALAAGPLAFPTFRVSPRRRGGRGRGHRRDASAPSARKLAVHVKGGWGRGGSGGRGGVIALRRTRRTHRLSGDYKAVHRFRSVRKISSTSTIPPMPAIRKKSIARPG